MSSSMKARINLALQYVEGMHKWLFPRLVRAAISLHPDCLVTKDIYSLLGIFNHWKKIVAYGTSEVRMPQCLLLPRKQNSSSIKIVKDLRGLKFKGAG